MNKALLEIRRELKERKPVFIRQDNPKRRKLNDKWRKPKGIHSKIRHHFKGRRKMPSPGYKSPRQVKGMHSSGLAVTVVHSVDDMNKIKKETHGAVISKSVGTKKKLEILKAAKKNNIQILNINIDDAIKKIEDFVSLKSSKKTETKKEESKEKQEKKQKDKQEPKEKENPLSDEEKKEAEKKERDKLLTKKV